MFLLYFTDFSCDICAFLYVYETSLLFYRSIFCRTVPCLFPQKFFFFLCILLFFLFSSGYELHFYFFYYILGIKNNIT